jgi:hypothetical protein
LSWSIVFPPWDGVQLGIVLVGAAVSAAGSRSGSLREPTVALHSRGEDAGATILPRWVKDRVKLHPFHAVMFGETLRAGTTRVPERARPTMASACRAVGLT